MKMLVFGCGYLGTRVAQYWVNAGHEVSAVTRSPQRGAELTALGIHPLVGDIVSPTALPALPAADVVLFAVGYDRRAAGPSITQVYAEGLKNVLDTLARQPTPPARIIYISSTSVYGQAGGEWIDEDTPCEPAREGGQACLAAEGVLWASALAARGLVLRLAGIYGPGRIPRRRDLEQGEPIPAAPDSFLNLIHVDDAASIVVSAAQVETSSRLYVVADGHPVLRRDFYGELASLLALPTPKFVASSGDPNDRRSRTSHKMVRNSRMQRELNVKLEFPSYREGLAAIVRSDDEAS